MELVKVNVVRKHVTINLPSIEGGMAVFVRASVGDQAGLNDEKADNKEKYDRTLDLLQKCFIEWNLADADGVVIPFTPEMVGKTCSELDIIAMLQAVTGRQMLTDDGSRSLSPEEIAKKGLSA